MIKSTTLQEFFFTLGVTLALLLSSTSLFASEVGNEKKHFAGVFIGVFDNDDTESVFGLEYEYKLNSRWGLGFVYEDAKDAHHGDGISSSIAAGYYHPFGGLRLGLGLGREKVGGSHGHSEKLYRLGVSYDFHIGDFGIAPGLNLDSVGGEIARVYGVTLVYSW